MPGRSYVQESRLLLLKTKQEMEIKIDNIVSVSVDEDVVTCNYQ